MSLLERIYRVKARIDSLIMQRFGDPTYQPTYTYLPPWERPVACVIQVRIYGRVTPIPDVKVELIVPVYFLWWVTGERVVATYYTDSNGIVKLTLAADRYYKFRLQKTGYKGYTEGWYKGAYVYDITQRQGYMVFPMQYA